MMHFFEEYLIEFCIDVDMCDCRHGDRIAHTVLPAMSDCKSIIDSAMRVTETLEECSVPPDVAPSLMGENPSSVIKDRLIVEFSP